MKDEKLFLEADFYRADLIIVKLLLEENGWIITYSKNHMRIYESELDFKFEDFTSESKGNTFDEAFLSCLIDIQKYYKRVM